MKCPKCQHENRDGAKFYEECGTRLSVTGSDFSAYGRTGEDTIDTPVCISS